MSPSHHPADVLPPVKTPFKFMLAHAVTVHQASEHGVRADAMHAQRLRAPTDCQGRGWRSVKWKEKKKKEGMKKRQQIRIRFLAGGASDWIRAIVPQKRASCSLRVRPHSGIHFNHSKNIHLL